MYVGGKKPSPILPIMGCRGGIFNIRDLFSLLAGHDDRIEIYIAAQ